MEQAQSTDASKRLDTVRIERMFGDYSDARAMTGSRRAALRAGRKPNSRPVRKAQVKASNAGPSESWIGKPSHPADTDSPKPSTTPIRPPTPQTTSASV